MIWRGGQGGVGVLTKLHERKRLGEMENYYSGIDVQRDEGIANGRSDRPKAYSRGFSRALLLKVNAFHCF